MGKRRRAMADLGIGDDVPSDHALGNLVMLALRRCEHLKHNYKIDPTGVPTKQSVLNVWGQPLSYGRGSVWRLIPGRGP